MEEEAEAAVAAVGEERVVEMEATHLSPATVRVSPWTCPRTTRDNLVDHYIFIVTILTFCNLGNKNLLFLRFPQLHPKPSLAFQMEQL